MKTLLHNSQEFIKSKIVRSVDGSKAFLHSEDVCYQEFPCDRDEAFNEAITYASEILLKEGFNHSETEDCGDSCTQIWTK